MNKIIYSTSRMRNLINDLLNYSKLSANSQFDVTDLNAILKDTMVDLELAFEETGAKIIIEELPSIEAIAGQMRQAFQNIISNSLKFSKNEESPVVKIWGERTDEKELSERTSPLGEYLRIYIQDNGIGFNERHLDKIFSIFQRLHTRQEYEGTGIGLAIVKKIVEKHNGFLTAKSQVGIGTTFIMVLPIRQTIQKKSEILFE
jgi:signal transduction histidine kinase